MSGVDIRALSCRTRQHRGTISSSAIGWTGDGPAIQGRGWAILSCVLQQGSRYRQFATSRPQGESTANRAKEAKTSAGRTRRKERDGAYSADNGALVRLRGQRDAHEHLLQRCARQPTEQDVSSNALSRDEGDGMLARPRARTNTVREAGGQHAAANQSRARHPKHEPGHVEVVDGEKQLRRAAYWCWRRPSRGF